MHIYPETDSAKAFEQEFRKKSENFNKGDFSESENSKRINELTSMML